MSTILLTSGGIRFQPVADAFVSILPKKLSEIRMAHIMTATKMARHLKYLEEDRAAFARLGISYDDIDIEGKTADELRTILKDYDVIYVQGGDPYYLLKHIKLSEFDVVVKELIAKGKLYVGVSAGSYVACPTLESALWKRPERARHGLPDTEPALQLVDFLVQVHYKDDHREVIQNGMAHTTLPVRILTDTQALLIRNGNVHLVGSGEEVRL